MDIIWKSDAVASVVFWAFEHRLFILAAAITGIALVVVAAPSLLRAHRLVEEVRAEVAVPGSDEHVLDVAYAVGVVKVGGDR